MARNQLPEGVGKKIVEALKRQAEADISYTDDNNNISNSVPLTEIEDFPEIQSVPNLEPVNGADNNFIIEEIDEKNTTLPDGIYKTKENTEQNNTIATLEELDFVEQKQESAVQTAQPQYQQPISQSVQQPSFQQSLQQPSYQEPVKPQPVYQQPIQQNTYQQPAQPQKSMNDITVNLPSNVLMLKNLISTLPVGVTKQTGAQIIRQTLEAMGISMTSVLKQAQEIQEELNTSTRECMLKMQEYKTQIMQLEQSVQEYQRNMNQINDLVSLFLLTDKN